MRFLKMHGLGNDFVILDQKEVKGMLTNAQIRQICDRHFGVGCDQLVVLETSQKADIFARFFNPDGSESGACGNATRCVADLVMRESGQESCTVETGGGVLACRQTGEHMIEVDMGPPKLDWQEIPLSEQRDTLHLGIGEGLARDPVAVNMGNPHCVFFVDDLSMIDIDALGPMYETWPLFPQRTNVEFVQVLDRGKVRLKTWERGAGLTLACGSAACATVVAAARRDLTDRRIEVHVDGGMLELHWRESDDHVLMTGPAAYVFDGKINLI